ncbi:hypothetical protein EJ05DRAFT_112174 [Pseudovirgaria hyperparasitica]|uniref:WW domain-containing protein n=1 Tax=Pseudovirgaria hyperparasitica TaxID=470096 RepID=A0A6A6VZL4_9PEZI|nr:uncharacterized protein EJ05DRAFT_112174 [Pseudovirgaria hyperparasitica]KAF2755685.1 hypothetical protein EJ05DRAFT_112174 [Pseudovirgaria hyperparasitica]
MNTKLDLRIATPRIQAERLQWPTQNHHRVHPHQPYQLVGKLCGTVRFEWFYVNIYTKKSQWDKPTEPIFPPGNNDLAPEGPPPSYAGGPTQPLHGEKTGLSSNNPYASPAGPGGASASHDISEDERLARQLQDEENARAGGRPNSRGAADGYYNAPQGAGYQQGYPQGQQYAPPQQPYGQQDPYTGQYEGDKGKKKGGLSGLLGKLKGSSGGSRPHSYGQSAYGTQPGYGAAPYGRPMGGGMPMMGGGRRPGGLGAGGGMALGAAGGLAGGELHPRAVLVSLMIMFIHLREV